MPDSREPNEGKEFDYSKLPSDLPEQMLADLKNKQSSKSARNLRRVWGLIRNGKYDLLYTGEPDQSGKQELIDFVMSPPAEQQRILNDPKGNFLANMDNRGLVVEFSEAVRVERILLEDEVTSAEVKEFLQNMDKLEELIRDFEVGGNIDDEEGLKQYQLDLKKFLKQKNVSHADAYLKPELVEELAKLAALPAWLARIRLCPQEKREQILKELPIVERVFSIVVTEGKGMMDEPEDREKSSRYRLTHDLRLFLENLKNQFGKL